MRGGLLRLAVAAEHAVCSRDEFGIWLPVDRGVGGFVSTSTPTQITRPENQDSVEVLPIEKEEAEWSPA